MWIVKFWRIVKACIGLSLLILIGWAIVGWLGGDNAPPARHYMAVDAVAMISQYQANEAEGDKLYKDKHVQFTGTVTDIGSGVFSGADIKIDGDYYGFGGIEVFLPSEQAAKLHKGQTVTVRGQVMGRYLQVITVADGEIIK